MIIKEEIVETYFMNYKGQLSNYGIVNIVEDKAANALDEIGKNNFVMREKYNAAWVITKNKIEFVKEVLWNESIIVKSFISKINRITLEVDVIIFNKKDEIIAQAKLEFCLIDLENRKIKRLSECDINESTLTSLSMFDNKFVSIDDTNSKLFKEVRVEAMEVDMSLHTNNKEYFRYILNCYTVLELLKGIKSIEIHYLKETREKDVIKIYKNSNDGDNFILYSNDKKVSEAKVIWNK